MCLVRGDETDEDTIETAVSLMAGNNRYIRFVYVIVVERRFALDAPNSAKYREAERVLQEAEQMSGQRVSTRGSILKSRAIGPVLVREALDNGSDVIVASAKVIVTVSGKSMDDTSDYLIANAPCAVVLVRGAVSDYGNMPGRSEAPAASGIALEN
jgi:nucleotide-binding universal stress UspA family protein